jgi:hypothetical protein
VLVVESDSMEVVHAVQNPSELGMEAVVIDDCRHLLMSTIKHCPREANVTELTRYGSTQGVRFFFGSRTLLLS